MVLALLSHPHIIACGHRGRRDVVRFWSLIPPRDLWAIAVWLTGLFGNRVRWRDQELTLDGQGRIIHSGPIENGPLDATLPRS